MTEKMYKYVKLPHDLPYLSSCLSETVSGWQLWRPHGGAFCSGGTLCARARCALRAGRSGGQPIPTASEPQSPTGVDGGRCAAAGLPKVPLSTQQSAAGEVSLQQDSSRRGQPTTGQQQEGRAYNRTAAGEVSTQQDSSRRGQPTTG